MNWPEFVAKCEAEMTAEGFDPKEIKVRVEVSDSYYDKDVIPIGIYCIDYDGLGKRLVIWGG